MRLDSRRCRCLTGTGRWGKIARKMLWTVGILIVLIAAATFAGCWCLLQPVEVPPEEAAARKWAEGPGDKWVTALGGRMKTDYIPMAGRVAGCRVDLSGTRVLDADLHHLNGFGPLLLELDLSETEVDGSGMPDLRKLGRGSMRLSLRGTRVTDETLSRLVDGVNFSQLDLGDTGITDAGIEALLKADANSGGSLDLSNTKVTRAGIRRLKGIRLLRALSLQGLPLTDEDVPMLADLADKDWNLWTLDVSGARLSAKGIDRLHEAVEGSTVIVAGKRSLSLESCEPTGDRYRIAPYLTVARALQEEGKDVAVAKLRHWAKMGYEDQVLILCRMLFEPKEGGELRAPRMGRGDFLGGTSRRDWRLRPIALHKNVPVLIEKGDELGRIGEASIVYVDYCVKSCRWREPKYTELDAETLREVIHDLIRKTAWKKALSETERAFLLNQAEPGVSPDKE